MELTPDKIKLASFSDDDDSENELAYETFGGVNGYKKIK